VKLGDNIGNVICDSTGNWKVFLDEMDAAENLIMQIVSGVDTIIIKNISVGEVWLCSGQSNMEFQLRNSLNGENEIAVADFPQLKLFTVKHNISEILLEDVEGKWEVCSPQTIRNFSAVAYYFAKNLLRELNVPVGLIQSTWGGTPIESWMSKETLDSNPDFQSVYKRWDKIIEDYPAAIQFYNNNKAQLLRQWKADSNSAVSKGVAPPRKPNVPDGLGSKNSPYLIYNAMIHPLASFSIKGAIWYQGESNVKRADEYQKLFPAMIKNWRKLFGMEFPFYFVQLPNFIRESDSSNSGWPELREAQLLTLSLANTGMAVTIDIGDPTDIHPKKKFEVGYRLSLIALNKLYKKSEIVYSGPIYKSHVIKKNKFYLKFDFAENGLIAKDINKLIGFTIAGKDKRFISANAKISSDEIIVWSDKVKKPVSVRYAWGANPKCNLINSSGIPASPFRTDNWNDFQPD
jgi:sialate O-acetylesterase